MTDIPWHELTPSHAAAEARLSPRQNLDGSMGKRQRWCSLLRATSIMS